MTVEHTNFNLEPELFRIYRILAKSISLKTGEAMGGGRRGKGRVGGGREGRGEVEKE